MNYTAIFSLYKEKSLKGRYITNNDIKPLLYRFNNAFDIKEAGRSVLGKPVYSVTAGKGATRVFIWSQMHGNESTATKSLFDFLNYLDSGDETANVLLHHFTYYIIPIANPDGAEAYTRANANNVDLNRDSVALSQPESRILRKAFEEFKPDYCYNMHDQRTIFGVEAPDGPKPATISFLAPAYNEAREINNNRMTAINLIVAMNEVLQRYVPGQVGRFDDAFNINCVGDMFQSLGVPTVLFEAGHYPDDYEREISREIVFFALLSGFIAIYENVIVVNKKTEYFNIPQNKIIFYDILYKNVKINYENKEKITNFASQYKEVLFEKYLIFQAIISEIGNLEGFSGHVEIDCGQAEFNGLDGSKMPKIDEKADFYIGFDRKFINGIEIK